MSWKNSRNRTDLVGGRFAIFMIAVLFAATAAGWILTEIFPPDFSSNMEKFAASWGGPAVKICSSLRLYDPFHSFWYTALLVLFFVTLLLCIATRWKSFVMRAFVVRPPACIEDIPRAGTGAEIHLGDPLEAPGSEKDPVNYFGRKYGAPGGMDENTRELLYNAVAGAFGRRGYSMAKGGSGGTILFAAVAGRWRFLGNLLFHSGLLVLTAGGMAGSIMGRNEFLYGRRGDILPLHGSADSVRVDDFRIVVAPDGRVRDYISTLSVVDNDGNVLKSGEIEVNKPLKSGGFNIYQSAYYVDEEIVWAELRYMSAEGAPLRFRIGPGNPAVIEGTGYRVIAGRFFPDFRMGRGGPYSASPQMVNPALQIELVSAADTLSGYLFLVYPKFNSVFGDAGTLILEDLEPVYYTGLEITSNPGAPLMVSGMGISSVGLILLYMFSYKKVKGYITGEKMVMRAAPGRHTMSFREEMASMEKETRAAFAAVLRDMK